MVRATFSTRSNPRPDSAGALDGVAEEPFRGSP